MKLKKLKDYKFEDLGILLFGLVLLFMGIAFDSQGISLHYFLKGILILLGILFITPPIHEDKKEEIKEDEITQEQQDN